MSGWVKYPREVLNRKWFHRPNALKMFTYLIIKANYERKDWNDVPIQPGEIITSLTKLVEETELTHRNVRTALKQLKKEGDIEVFTNSKFTRITIPHLVNDQSEESEKSINQNVKNMETDDSKKRHRKRHSKCHSDSKKVTQQIGVVNASNTSDNEGVENEKCHSDSEKVTQKVTQKVTTTIEGYKKKNKLGAELKPTNFFDRNKIFHDTQIEKNTDERYINFIRLLYGNNEIGKPLKMVTWEEGTISYLQFKRLDELATHGSILVDTCLSLHNYEVSYKNLYLTLKRWLSNNNKK